MRRHVFLLILALSLGLAAQDYTCLSRTELLGTARYMGMAGAMTAVGGDPSAVRVNPAVLGLYRRAEAILTLGGSWRGVNPNENTVAERRQWRFNALFPQASVVIPFERYEGVLMSTNLMLSYQREYALQRNYNLLGGTSASLSDLMATEVSAGVLDGVPLPEGPAGRYKMELRESGHTDRYCVDLAFNFKHRVYLGFGLHVLSIDQSQDAVYSEVVGSDRLENTTTVMHLATAAQLTAGLLWRPTRWIRLGASFHTPSFGRTREYTSGFLISEVEGEVTRSNAPDMNGVYGDFHYPMLLSLGVAGQIGQYGLLSLQYDFRHSSGLSHDQHALRAGVEVVPVKQLFLNLGYSFESVFTNNLLAVAIDKTLSRQDAYYLYSPVCQYITAGIGYRGRLLIAQLAYQYRRENVNIFAHQNAAAMALQHDQHRLVLTIGWHN